MQNQKNSLRGRIWSWYLFDWGNSAFAAVILTFVFAPYFTQAVAADPLTGSAQWGTAMTISALVIAIASPILGVLSDKAGRRKPWIGFFSLLCILCSGLMWFVGPSQQYILLALVLLAFANIGFELGIVFYNALLPTLAPKNMIGRISGWGWGLGYLGGLGCLGLAWIGLIAPEQPLFGLNAETSEPVRAAAPLAALWFVVFAAPLFLLVPDGKPSGLPARRIIAEGFRDLAATFRLLRAAPSVGWFLLAHMIYIDGLNTIFLFGAIYAAGTFEMGVLEVLEFGIALNLAAALGAVSLARADDIIGPKRVLVYSLVAATIIGIGIVTTTSKTWLWILGVSISFFFGPIQSASRSMMAQLAPPERESQIFGLYALSGKATAFLGPALFTVVVQATQSQRAGLATVLPFFLVGLGVLLMVKEPALRDR